MNRFWNVAATGAALISVAVVSGASMALVYGSIESTMYATLVLPIATGWIGAMAALLPKSDK